MLHITKKVKKITKASASSNEVRIELESAVNHFNDIIVALESSNPTLLAFEMSLAPKSSNNLSHEYQQVLSLLDCVLAGKISYGDASKKMITWRNKLYKNIIYLAKFQ
jgi:hypothetical protein